MQSREDINDAIQAKLAPGERILLRTGLHWGVFAAPVFLLFGLMAWGSMAATVLLIASAWSLTRAIAFEGVSRIAITRRRILVVMIPARGRPGAFSLRW